MNIRKAVFAGSWYPETAKACEKEIKAFLKEPIINAVPARNYIGGIVPHAGWFYSGCIACNVIHCLREEFLPDVLVVFGMHLHSKSPNYIMTDGAWETPFGPLPIHSELAAELTKQFAFEIETPDYFTQDNTIELQLPFVKYFIEDVRIVPIGVPPVQASLEIGKAIVDIAKNLNLRLKVLGSTDLTHYGYNYGFVPKGSGSAALEWVRNENDKKMVDAMLEMDPLKVMREAISSQNACCSGAAATAIATGKYLGAEHAEMVAYATSYDKSPGDSFVGYVGLVF